MSELDAPPRVFISYSHDSESHCAAVLELAQRLRAVGIDAWIDRFEPAPPQGWPRWIADQLEAARYVLLICTATYKQRFAGKDQSLQARRVSYEGLLAQQLLFQGKLDLHRLVPVLFEPADSEDIPHEVAGATSHVLPEGFEALVDQLTDRLAVSPASLDSTESALCDGMPSDPDLGDQLAALHLERERLERAEEDTTEIRQEILRVRRLLRDGNLPRIGDIVDNRYQLKQIAGRGGFGIVWQAWDFVDRRHVAVKILQQRWVDDRTRLERFIRGAREMAELRHPAIVPVLRGYVADDDLHFYVMDWMPGRDLATAVRQGSLSTEPALRALVRIGEALDFAHGKGVIHRDVKPQNILLDDEGNAALTDFDLVHVLDTTAGTGMDAMGTFAYAAPEQLEDASSVDDRVDVYGLGMTALFCLLRRDPPPMAAKTEPELLHDLPCSKELALAIGQAIAYDRDTRAPDCTALVRCLRMPHRSVRKELRGGRWALGVVVLGGIATTIAFGVKFAIEQVILGATSTGSSNGVAQVVLLDTGHEMALIGLTGGEFTMGSPKRELGHEHDELRRRMTVERFEICRTEVSVAQYEHVIPTDKPTVGYPATLPMTEVSWDDALRFLNELTKLENRGREHELTECYDLDERTWDRSCTGYRLPTEAEWEFAARAGTTTPWSFGSNLQDLCDHANVGDDCPKTVGLTPVESLRVNPWGLYGMHGNAEEWVFDGDESDEKRRVVRGGSCESEASAARSASRAFADRDTSTHYRGFRCARGAVVDP